MDPMNILSRLQEGHAHPPTDAELTSAAAQIQEALDAATGPDAATDADSIALAKDLHAALQTIAKVQTEREAVIAANRDELAKLREGIFDSAPAEEETTDEDADEVEAEVEVEAPVAIAASATDLVNRLTAKLKTAVPAETSTKMTNAVTLKPVGAASAFELDTQAGFADLGHLFGEFARGEGGKNPLVRLTRTYPENRRLGSNVELNNKRIAEVMGTGQLSRANMPIAASGGLCGPGDVDHSHPICSQRGRVVTPALTQFNASRGRVTVAPVTSIGDLEGNVSVWTSETDANPGQSVKPCPALECPEDLTASVDAVVKCVTVGNFQAKFSPEWWAANLEVLAAAHDREAEQKALVEIYTASTSFGTVNEGSTLWNFIQALTNVISADKSARRNWDGGYTAIADAYGKDQMRNQLAANLGAGGDIRQALVEADMIIDDAIRVAGVTNMVWTYDGTYNGSGHRLISVHSQSGHLPPADFGLTVFPTEAFLFLDGGTLDLGTDITDSALNATNDRQAFAETFEKVLFRGCGSFRGVITIDASCGCGLTSI